MIYPTRRAILLMAIGAPVALLIGLVSPGYWAVGGGWVVLVLGLSLLDAFIGPSRASAVLSLDTPGVLGIAGKGLMTVRAVFERSAPSTGEIAIETNARLSLQPDRMTARFVGRDAAATVDLTPLRRGEGEILCRRSDPGNKTPGSAASRASDSAFNWTVSSMPPSSQARSSSTAPRP